MTETFRTMLHAAAALLLLLAALPAAGAAPATPALSAQDRTDLARIEIYLNSISTVRARFTQISETQGLSQGEFYLSRPGRMRIEYDPPVPYLYVADGTWLTFWDSRLGQRSDVLLGSTLADFITRESIRLSGDVTVTGVHREPGTIKVDLVQTEDPGEGRLTLQFQDNPLQLQSWRVVDAQGLTTEVWLTDPAFGVPLASNLFVAPRPPSNRQ